MLQLKDNNTFTREISYRKTESKRMRNDTQCKYVPKER